MPSRRAGPRIEVMDTTLRDGEQTPDVAYTPGEKLQLARLLLEGVGVDRIEIAQTHVSQGERQAAARVLYSPRCHFKGQAGAAIDMSAKYGRVYIRSHSVYIVAEQVFEPRVVP